MTKIRSSFLPLAYFDAVRSSWEDFADELTPHSYLRELFIETMHQYESAFEHALVIDHVAIETYLNNLCSSFPQSDHEKIERKFLELLSHYSPKVQVKSVTPGEKIRPLSKVVAMKTLQDISKDNHDETIKTLLKKMNIIEDDGTCLLKGRGTTLFATIDAVKEKGSHILKRDSYTDRELLTTFNNYLGTQFRQIKRRGTTFSTDKARAEFLLKKLLY